MFEIVGPRLLFLPLLCFLNINTSKLLAKVIRPEASMDHLSRVRFKGNKEAWDLVLALPLAFSVTWGVHQI